MSHSNFDDQEFQEEDDKLEAQMEEWREHRRKQKWKHVVWE